MSIRFIVWFGLVAVSQMVSSREIRKCYLLKSSNRMPGGSEQNARFNFDLKRNHGTSGQACREIQCSYGCPRYQII